MTDTSAHFLLPFLGHMGLIGVLMAVLTWQRVGAVLSGEAKVDDYARANGDSSRSRRVQRNLSNQFELPVLAYFAAAVLIATNAVQPGDIIAAWIFLGGRVLHALVQTLTDNVRLRGAVFCINAGAIAFLIYRVASIALQGVASAGVQI
jgi:hypothetical protein